MQNAIKLFTVLAILASSPVFAGTASTGKDECLLNAKKCLSKVDDIQQRMHRLNREIKKGTRVYSPKELAKLHDKLQEVQKILTVLEKDGR